MYILTGTFLKRSPSEAHRVELFRLRYIRPLKKAKVICTSNALGHMYLERVMCFTDLRKAPPEHYKGIRRRPYDLHKSREPYGHRLKAI